MNRIEANNIYNKLIMSKDIKAMKLLAQKDLFFLMTRILLRDDMNKDWHYARCREVQANPYGYLDLWARDHYKSSIITVGNTIQEIINNPELTIGIFSHTQKIAREFLKQIKRYLETSQNLKTLFPDIFYQNPEKQSPQWSEEKGIIVKRKTNPKEATIEGWGLTTGQPTGKHFTRMVYDDIVTRESVNTPDQILLTTEMWELSLNIADQRAKYQYIGTRYHANDTYSEIIKRKAAIARVHPATVDGTDSGEPVFLPKEILAEKRKQMGVYTFSCQMLLNPLADKSMGFSLDWINYFEPKQEFIEKMNRVIIVDPSSGKNKSDYTVMVVIGFNADRKRYLIYGVRDRLSLQARSKVLFELVKKYRPQHVVYEEYGMQADIEYIRLEQERQNYRFPIIPIGGRVSKKDRILALVPHFEQRDFILANSATFKDTQGDFQDFIRLFIDDEYQNFPVCQHDDMLDAIARSVQSDLAMEFPEQEYQYKQSVFDIEEISTMGMLARYDNINILGQYNGQD